MSVSVIIASTGRIAVLRQTLDSLAGQLSECAAGCEVIVVGTGDAATRELAHEYAAMPMQWLCQEQGPGQEQNFGLAAARNRGAARARGEILLFLGEDTPAAAGLLQAHISAHARQSRAGQMGASRIAVCGRVVESAGAGQRSQAGRLLANMWTEARAKFETARSDEEEELIPADAVTMSCFGLNCSITRELFEAAGGFNPALRYLDGEMEMGCRLYLRGVRLVSEPGAVVCRRHEDDRMEEQERCWLLAGRDHVLRAVQMGERNGQTRQLLAMDTGPLLARVVNRVFFHANALACGLAAMLRKLTERSGSRASFRLWQATARRQRYWQAVREAGVGREQLREMAGNPLRIIMLHSVAQPQNATEASYYLSPARFRQLLETIQGEGYCCADPMKLEDETAKWDERELVLTFDDGYDDFYSDVFPLVESYGLQPLMFVVADRIGGWNLWDQAMGVRQRRLMDLAQLRELRRHGVRFGSHTMTHPRLPCTSDEQLRRELQDSRHKLEDLFGEAITMLAYPYGAANRRVRAAAIEAGYKVAVTTSQGLNVWQDSFSLLRVDFNEQVWPQFYRWKLRQGVGPRRTMKNEALALLRMMPRPRKPADTPEKHWKSNAAQG